MVDYPLVIFLGLALIGGAIWLFASLYKPSKKKKNEQSRGDTCLECHQDNSDIYTYDLESMKRRALYEATAKKFKLNLMGIFALLEMSRVAEKRLRKNQYFESDWYQNR